MTSSIPNPKEFLTGLFRQAVDAADPMKVVANYLPSKPEGRLLIIGAGKASARMAAATEANYGPCEGYVITRYGYGEATRRIEIVEAAHPVPDAAGEAATKHLLGVVADLSENDTVIALISGGGSALLCAPVDGVSLKDKMDVNAALLASGAPISEMNKVRKRLSRVKGGKLAAACHPARLITLMISDVPGDDPALIASGPTVGDSGTAAEALEIIDKWGIELADHVREAIWNSNDGPSASELIHCENHTIAAPSKSLDVAAAAAEGLDVRILGDALEGEARVLAAEHAMKALQIQAGLAPSDKPVLLLSGGECTVTQRGNGVGGPNAEYVLAAANALSVQAGIHVLACDTDGVDGAAEVAGAYASSETVKKAKLKGVSLSEALENNDAHRFFELIDDQIVTGPTLTNVNDFRAMLVFPNQ